MEAPLCKICGHRHYGTNHLTDAAAARAKAKAKAGKPERQRTQPSRLVAPPTAKKRRGGRGR